MLNWEKKENINKMVAKYQFVTIVTATMRTSSKDDGAAHLPLTMAKIFF